MEQNKEILQESDFLFDQDSRNQDDFDQIIKSIKRRSKLFFAVATSIFSLSTIFGFKYKL